VALMREWIVGRNPVYETLRAGRRSAHRLLIAQGVQTKGRLSTVIEQCEADNIPIDNLPRRELDEIAGRSQDSAGHQGVALEVGPYPYSTLLDILELADELGEPPFLLILDTLQDPQNLATLLRTAEGVGVHGVLLPLRRAAMVTPAVVSASSGASEHLLITQMNLAQAIASLKGDGLWVVGLEHGPEAKTPSEIRLDGAIALVVGNEGSGMRSLVRSSCDFLMRLPMRGHIESLNAAVAGSIALYLVWQARSSRMG
jgi:23S rRNA (guanosine2251-2'-O)-methyltransferase